MVKGELMRTKIILASRSPQRKKILKKLIDTFEIRVSDVDETFDNSLSVYENVKEVAKKKAFAIRNSNNECIIACDTVCYLDNLTLTKPKDRVDAFNMILSYNNKIQEVITGVCIITPKNVYNFYEISTVKFKDIDEESINLWLNENRFMDKAGSFEILEAPKYFDIEIAGSINNIVGLPIESIKDILKNEKII